MQRLDAVPYILAAAAAAGFALVALSGCLAFNTGELEVHVAGEGGEEFESLVVTFSRAEARRQGGGIGAESPEPGVERGADAEELEPDAPGWTQLSVQESRLDLTDTGTEGTLVASERIGEGPYSGVALIISEVRGVRADGSEQELLLISGSLRADHPFNVTQGQTTRILVEVNLADAIEEDPESGAHRFIPVAADVQVS